MIMKNSSITVPECEVHEIHPREIQRARVSIPSSDILYTLSDFFKLFGDSTRLGILFALNNSPLCVCDIAETLDMTKSAVSHQLKALRQSDLVRYKKVGKNVIYSLADSHVKDIIDIALKHINE